MTAKSAMRAAGLVAKRVLDASISLLVLAVASPVLIVIAAVVRANLGSPVLFRQERPGMRARRIRVLKFRTMRDARDAQGRPLPDDARLTPVGRLLRATSLDELPQLWNVLKGDMSLVGPRPLLVQYLDRYTPEQARRHEVKPGITGWAQVNGRNAISWEQKFALDVWYVDNWSLWLDLRILALTGLKVFRREGISSDGHATMPEFIGTSGSADGRTDGMRLKRIAVIGAGGFAREVKWLIQEINAQTPSFEFVGYVVSDMGRVGEHDSKDEILGDTAWLRQNRSHVDALAIGIGTPAARLAVSRELASEFPLEFWPALIHPSVRYDRATCQVGHGVILGAGTIVTVNVRFEPFCMVNLACTVGHESVIGEGSVLNPTVNISGGVDIGEGVLVGTGAQVLQYLRVGTGAVVGGGAVVTKDLPPGVTAVGVPARPLASRANNAAPAVALSAALLQQAVDAGGVVPKRLQDASAPTTEAALILSRTGMAGGVHGDDK